MQNREERVLAVPRRAADGVVHRETPNAVVRRMRVCDQLAVHLEILGRLMYLGECDCGQQPAAEYRRVGRYVDDEVYALRHDLARVAGVLREEPDHDRGCDVGVGVERERPVWLVVGLGEQLANPVQAGLVDRVVKIADGQDVTGQRTSRYGVTMLDTCVSDNFYNALANFYNALAVVSQGF